MAAIDVKRMDEELEWTSETPSESSSTESELSLSPSEASSEESLEQSSEVISSEIMVYSQFQNTEDFTSGLGFGILAGFSLSILIAFCGFSFSALIHEFKKIIL